MNETEKIDLILKNQIVMMENLAYDMEGNLVEQIKKTQGNRPEYIKLSTAQSDSGKMTTLISESGVHCYNKELWPDHPQFKDTYRCIPRSLCRKCEFYRKGGYDRIKYPHCDWLRKERGGDKGAVKEIFGLVNKAVKETERMMM